ncbi:hypothetical protein PMAYCL1PPCAC_17585, partial [Pristionchus mayeri]
FRLLLQVFLSCLLFPLHGILKNLLCIFHFRFLFNLFLCTLLGMGCSLSNLFFLHIFFLLHFSSILSILTLPFVINGSLFLLLFILAHLFTFFNLLSIFPFCSLLFLFHRFLSGVSLLGYFFILLHFSLHLSLLRLIWRFHIISLRFFSRLRLHLLLHLLVNSLFDHFLHCTSTLSTLILTSLHLLSIIILHSFHR